MGEHITEYLNIAEPIGFDNSVIDYEYIVQEPNNGTNLNSATTTVLSIEPTSDWLLPSESYLYVEGKVTKADGTTIQKIAPGVWPNFALLNNFFPYMYQTMRYYLNGVEIEAFNYPGQCTTMKHLVTKSNKFNGLDMGWVIDTYDGQATYRGILYEEMKPYAAADFVAANAAAPTQDETVAFALKVFTDFNDLNPNLQVAAPTDAQIRAVVTGALSVAILKSLVSDIFIHYFNVSLYAPPISRDGIVDPPGFTTAQAIAYINEYFIKRMNAILNDSLNAVTNYNTGYKTRKDLIFNPVPNVMNDSEAGDFSFRIPLSHLFNFCEDYRKVMFNCKHQLQLTRQINYMPVFKVTFLDYKATINLNTMRWYMPKITANLNMQKMMLEQISSGIEVDLAFMNKKIDYFSLNNLNRFTAQINYATGIEKPRYIVAGFQTIDTANADSNDTQNINYAIFNGTNLNGANNLMVDVNYVNLKINGTLYNLMDSDNSFNQNRIGRWYNEYKHMKKNYKGDNDEDDIIDFFAYRNLYRLYVFDISKQTEQLTATGVANVSLEFNFNQPAVAPPATMKTELYIVSFFDRIWKLKSDGTKQFVVK